MYGLKKSDLEEMNQLFIQYQEIESVVIFGSRAIGHQRNGSDVDLALKGEGVSFDTILNISDSLNEDSDMPYQFDVLNYHAIQNQDLINHIDRVGIILYNKKKSPVTP